MKGKWVVLICVLTLALLVVSCTFVDTKTQDSDKIAKQIQKYFSLSSEAGQVTQTTKSKVSLEYSTEGAYIFAKYTESGKIQYLNVDICSEMGREITEFTYAHDCIIYSVVDIGYTEPFYMNPIKPSISHVDYRRYIIQSGQMYQDIGDSELIVMTEEQLQEILVIMQQYIADLSEAE